MQIGPILNISSTAPAAAIQNPAVQGQAAGNAATSPSNTTDSTDNNDVQAGGQFASLITPDVKATKLTTPVTPPGDADSTAPQAINSIAVPPMPVFIDQPIQANLTKADTAVATASNNFSNKTPIFSSQPVASGKTAVAASEIADKQLDNEINNQAQIANNIQPAANNGKIVLNKLAQNQAQDPEFTKAVANIVAQANTKGLKPGEQDVVPKLPASTGDNKQVANANATNDNQQQLAQTKADPVTKITAKILNVKDETIDGDDSDESASPTVTANLQDFAAQLKTKSFNNVQTAHDALATTPTDQVKVQISQAVASGNNSVKITLHPVELGMVKVDMDTDHEGNTKISITADKADTLAMLKTDSHNLTKSLADAGIKTDNATMQFNLRGDSQGQQQQRDFGSNNFQQNNNGNAQQQQQTSSGGITGYSRFTNLNEKTLTLSANKGLNILV